MAFKGFKGNILKNVVCRIDIYPAAIYVHFWCGTKQLDYMSYVFNIEKREWRKQVSPGRNIKRYQDDMKHLIDRIFARAEKNQVRMIIRKYRGGYQHQTEHVIDTEKFFARYNKR